MSLLLCLVSAYRLQGLSLHLLQGMIIKFKHSYYNFSQDMTGKKPAWSLASCLFTLFPNPVCIELLCCDNIWRCPVFNLLFVLLLMLRRWIVFLRSMATTVSHHRLRNATTGCFFIFLWTFLRYFLADWKVESQYCSLCKLNYHRGETLTMPC